MTVTIRDVSAALAAEEDKARDDHASRAAALAAEALRLAEEAKRAAERVAEVRASLSLKSPMTSPRAAATPNTESEARDAKQTRRDPPSEGSDPPQGGISGVRSFGMPSYRGDAELRAELRKGLESDIATEKLGAVPVVPAVTPAAPNAVVEEKKEETPVASHEDDGIVDPSSVSMPAMAAVAEKKQVKPDLFEKMFDALGVDKLCGVDEETLRLAREEANKKYASQANPRGVGPSVSTIVEEPSKEMQETLNSTSEAAPVPPTPASESAAPVVVAAAEAAITTPAAAPVVGAPAEAATSTPAAAPIVGAPAEAATSTPAAAPIVGAPAAEEPVANPASTPVAESEAAKEETPEPTISPSDVAAAMDDIAVQRHVNVAVQKSVTMETARRFRSKRLHPVLNSPDPFGGEHDDFMPCGCADQTYDDVLDYDLHQQSSIVAQPAPVVYQPAPAAPLPTNPEEMTVLETTTSEQQQEVDCC